MWFKKKKKTKPLGQFQKAKATKPAHWICKLLVCTEWSHTERKVARVGDARACFSPMWACRVSVGENEPSTFHTFATFQDEISWQEEDLWVLNEVRGCRQEFSLKEWVHRASSKLGKLTLHGVSRPWRQGPEEGDRLSISGGKLRLWTSWKELSVTSGDFSQWPLISESLLEVA